jgi:hypothetical protein
MGVPFEESLSKIYHFRYVVDSLAVGMQREELGEELGVEVI